MREIDREIIERAADGDMDAFEEIYRASSGYVYTVALRVTGSKEDAEEVTQDVFVSVHRSLPGFGFRSSFKTWLYRIAMNRAINAYRKRSKDRKRRVELDENTGAEGPEGIKRAEDREAVGKMLEKLPPEQRACLVLKEIDGMKYEEIADTLKINLNTVRTRIKRAREKLVSIYGKGGAS